jgi:hypothetical protein
VPRIIFGLQREEVAGGWRRLQNEELRNLYASLIIISDQIKEYKMSGTSSTQQRDEQHTTVLSQILKGRDHLEKKFAQKGG